MNNTKMGEEHMSKNANRAVAKQVSATRRTASKKIVARWRTEGCIQEVKLDGKSVTLQIEPTEAFAAEVDGAKKILLVKEAETDAKPVDAKLVEAKTSFAFNKEISLVLLYQIKKDHARIRMVVENLESASQIKSITFV